MIDSLSEEELFEPHMRKWADGATKTAVWEVYKFIHINTVAPIGTFRTKIRKWKKIVKKKKKREGISEQEIENSNCTYG